MAVSISTSGSQTATLTTQHTLATISTAGVFVLAVNLINLADGEDVELKAYLAVDTLDDRNLVYQQTYTHKQGDGTADTGSGMVVALSPPIPSPISIRFTLEQNGGSGRVFDWAIYVL